MTDGPEVTVTKRVTSLKELRRRYSSEAACRAFFELKLWTWVQALYLVVTSSKGVRGMARVPGITQSTAWRLGHSIREMMHDRDGKGPQLKGIVEIDIKYLGGAPKPRKDGAANPRGKGTSKARILIAAERDGAVQGTVIQAETIGDIEAATAGRIESGSWIMSDSQSAFQKALSKLAGVHATVNHSQGEYVRDDVHSSSADGFGFILERAKFGVWHKFGAQHV